MSEHDHQATVFQWADLYANRWPELHLMFAIPNGGHRFKATAGKLKAEGVKSGVPDIFLPVPRGVYHGLFIEMKANGNTPTPNQRVWIGNLMGQGYYACWCKGAEMAIETLMWYLKGADPLSAHAGYVGVGF